MSKPKSTRRPRRVTAAGEENALDQPSYSQDPQVHTPSMAPEPAPVPAPPKPEEGAVPAGEVATSPKVEGPHEDVLSQPLKYVVSSEDAIEKVETLLKLVQESRPDLQQQVAKVLQEIESLEKGAWGQQYPAHEGAEQAGAAAAESGLVFSPGDKVQVSTEGESYNGEIRDQNEDGTWEVMTDQNMLLSNVPTSSLQPADGQSAASMALPASAQNKAQRIRALFVNSSMVALLQGFIEGKTVTELMKDKTPDEIRETVNNWKQRLAEVGSDMESPEFLTNAIAEAEALLPQEEGMSKPKVTAKSKTGVKAGITRLPSGRWKDTNGNSYDSREEAAEAEAHSHVDQKLDPESPEYKEQHQAAMDEILGALKGKGRKIKADFMEKQVFESDGFEVETDQATYFFPTTEFSSDSVAEDFKDAVEGEVLAVQSRHGWFGRYSAPGYLDATEWVFAPDKETCEDELERLYGSDEGVEAKKKTGPRLKAKPEVMKALLAKAKMKPVTVEGGKTAAELFNEHPEAPEDAVEWAINARTEEAEDFDDENDPARIDVVNWESGGSLEQEEAVEYAIANCDDQEKVSAWKAWLDKKKELRTARDNESSASQGLEASVTASAFDEIKELELGNGWILRRKKGSKKGESDEPKPKGDKKDEAPKPDKKDEAKPVEAGLRAADDKGEKFEGPMIEVVSPDGKVKDTLPDAFGNDTVAIIKLFQTLYPETTKKGGAGEGKDKGGEPKGDAADKKNDKDKGDDKGKSKKDDEPSLESKPKALPAAPMVEVSEKEAKELEAAQKQLEQRIHQVRAIVTVLVEKNHVVADQKDIDEILMAQTKGKESLEAAMDAALSRAADRKFKELLATPEADLMLIKASLPNLPTRATQIRVQASQEGLDPVDSLSVQAQKIAQHGGYSVGDVFALGGRFR